MTSPPRVYFSVRCQLSDQTQSYRPSKQYYITDQPSEREVCSSHLTPYAVYTRTKTANSSCIRQLWTASTVSDTPAQLIVLSLRLRTNDTTRPLHFKNITSQQVRRSLNPLNAELHPICHLLALLGAHHILHIGRISLNIQIMLGTALANNAEDSPLPETWFFTLLSYFTFAFYPNYSTVPYTSYVRNSVTWLWISFNML